MLRRESRLKEELRLCFAALEPERGAEPGIVSSSSEPSAMVASSLKEVGLPFG